VSNYTKSTNFAAKDSLPSGNANKVVKGTEINTEFDNIATAIATKADLNSPTLVTPNLGTPSVAVLTNATGLPLTTGVTGTLLVANGGTGTNTFSAGALLKGAGTSAITTATAGTDYAAATTGTSAQLLANNGSGGFSNVTVGSGLSLSAGTLSTSGGASISAGDSNVTVSDTGSNGTVTVQTDGTERMRIDSSGNVGIGTSSPSYLLHAAGTNPRINVSASSTGYAGYRASNTSGTFQVAIDDSTGSNYLGTAYGRVIYSDGAYPLQFATNATERMRIDSSGNVGIGVTPSAWGSFAKALQIGSRTAVYQDTNDAIFSNNTYGATGGNTYIATAAATQYYQSSGTHVWRSAPSGTAGTTITFTQVLAVEKDKSLALQGATSQSGTGITFPATQSASSDANTLDDYEEGAWTPALKFGGNSTGMTISATGKYTKIGNVVYWTCDFALSAKGSSTGSATITGLPFTSFNGTYSPAVVWAYDMASLTGSIIYRVASNSTTIDIYQYDATGSNNVVTQANFNNASQNRTAGFYFI